MNKINKLGIAMLLTTSAFSVSAIEITKDFEVGAYGSVGYKSFENIDADSAFTSNNIYGEVTFDKLKVMIDVNGQFDQINIQGEDSKDMDNYDLYRAYISYDFNRSQHAKLGRIGAINFKGDNSLDIKSSMIDTTSPLKVFGHANYEHIDGALYRHSTALNNGKFETTFYGGKTYMLSPTGDQYEGEQYTAMLSFNKNGHKFLTGYDGGNYSNDSDSNLVSVDDLGYENIYFTYQYENKTFFTDNTYVISNYDDNSVVSDTKVIDAKLGVKVRGLKPFFGYNQVEIGDSTIKTKTVGLRYDYKSIGLILTRDDISGQENEEVSIENFSQIDEEIYTAKIIYNF